MSGNYVFDVDTTIALLYNGYSTNTDSSVRLGQGALQIKEHNPHLIAVLTLFLSAPVPLNQVGLPPAAENLKSHGESRG
jgi:hypothetical protein